MFKFTKELFRQSASYLKRDEPALLTFLFHSIFKDESEFSQKVIDPQQYVTVEVYRKFVESFLEAGYKFVTPEEVSGLEPGKYILSTFDDGYYNNSLVLPILKEFETPALFYITTDNVMNNKCYWWDVVFRELSKKGLERKAISKEQGRYKKMTHLEIEQALISDFGENCFTPVNDIDRPFTVSELQEFAKNESVHIGNHTTHHYILDQYEKKEQFSQINNCQKDLKDILGYEVKTVSYPNGNYNDETISICEELAFDLGITVDKRKNYFPLKNKLVLGRYVLWGNKSIKRQCDIFRSDIGK